MPKRSSKQDYQEDDINLIAKRIVDESAEDQDDEIAELIAQAEKEGKNPAAVLLGHYGGLKGGKARAEKLTAEERKEIARKAAKARWAKSKKGEG